MMLACLARIGRCAAPWKRRRTVLKCWTIIGLLFVLNFFLSTINGVLWMIDTDTVTRIFQEPKRESRQIRVARNTSRWKQLAFLMGEDFADKEAGLANLRVQLPGVQVSGADGHELARYTRDACDKHLNWLPPNQEKFWLKRMHTVSRHNHLYCPVEKVGTTFWRRVIFLATQEHHLSHPYQVPIYEALAQQFEPIEPDSASAFADYFKFMFVRNPYSRILSAYIDKVFVPNPQFWERFGKPAILKFRHRPSNRSATCGHDPSFSEFVKFTVWAETHNFMRDLHFMSMTDMCLPCQVNYTFIGKMESFTRDAFYVLKTLKQNDSISYLEKYFDSLSAYDAITDTIHSPFSWKNDILKCMSWDEALRRIWRKLQLRGIVGMDIDYPLQLYQAEQITAQDFINLARQAYRRSSKVELKKQKALVYRELYMGVPLADLVNLKTVYHADFQNFGYNDSPKEVFERSQNYKRHNFLDFRISLR